MSSTAPIGFLKDVPTGPASETPLDPHPVFVDLLEAGHKLIQLEDFENGGRRFIALGRELSEHILADPRFSGNVNRPGFHTSGVIGGLIDVFANSIVRLDDPEHARVRNLVTSEFRPRRLQEILPDVQQVVDECLVVVKEAGPGVDLVPVYSTELVSRAVSKLLGIREENRIYLKDLANEVNEPYVAALPPQEQPLNLLKAEIARLYEVDGFNNGMLKNLYTHYSTGAISHDELVSMGVLLTFGGHETTSNSIALGCAIAIPDRTLMAQLRDDPSLIERFTEEVLRLTAVTRSAGRRLATEDITVDGYEFKAGDTVNVSLQTANRDPDSFTNPHQVVLDRPRTEKMITFGAGMHMCIGQFLARAEMKAAFKGLFLGFNDLELLAPVPELPYKGASSIYTVASLPTTWSSTNF